MDERVGNPWQALLALLLVLGFSLIGTVGPVEGEECAKIHQVEITFDIATGFKPYTMVIQVDASAINACIFPKNVCGRLEVRMVRLMSSAPEYCSL